MNQTFNVFQSGKDKSKNVLVKLYSFLDRGEEVGAHFDESIKYKLRHAIDRSEAERINIALVGAYSEGKTSIAKAWLSAFSPDGDLPKGKEISDSITAYRLDENINLIDIPGLYGANLGAEDDDIRGRRQEIANTYISEAHIIVYVMNAVHPIKETHYSELKWIFRTLKLLPRTVFAISRFDEVADVTDERDFNEHFAIKRVNMIKQLDHAIMLNDREKNTLSVVCVSPNPFAMGRKYWSEHKDEWITHSRIKSLHFAVTEKVKANGGKSKIDLNMKHSIIKDVLGMKLSLALLNEKKIDNELSRLTAIYERLETQCMHLDQNVNVVIDNISRFITQYFDCLFYQLKGLTHESLADFYQYVIGENGAILENKLRYTFENRILGFYSHLSQILTNASIEVSHYNQAISLLGQHNKKKWLVDAFIIDDAIFSMIESNLSLSNAGFDFASIVRGDLWLGSADKPQLQQIEDLMKQWENMNVNMQHMHVADCVSKLHLYLEQYKLNLSVFLEGDNFMKVFDKQLTIIDQSVTSLRVKMQELEKRQKRYSDWRAHGDAIAAEFAVFS